MKTKIHIFQTPTLLIEAFGISFRKFIEKMNAGHKNINIALPGGSTPKRFFEYLSGPFSYELGWKHIHFYWGDERCVPPDHPDSNYGMTAKALFEKISIPDNQIHRIRGENDPEEEVLRYSNEIITTVPIGKNHLPQFDWIILGLGTDGHTASIFPHMSSSYFDQNVCTLASHPETSQRRISLSLATINNARRVSFLVSGKLKATMVASILNSDPESRLLPAAQVSPKSGYLEWFLDAEASSMLSK